MDPEIKVPAVNRIPSPGASAAREKGFAGHSLSASLLLRRYIKSRRLRRHIVWRTFIE
ncbi:MAG TPA: hypothetical protein VHT96_15130 [Clostridia bacterium]|nr:hypothetical protein [Clostridia bacterium]